MSLSTRPPRLGPPRQNGEKQADSRRGIGPILSMLRFGKGEGHVLFVVER